MLKKRKMKGFTLIELIVVIAIIVILAAIIVPLMLGYVKSSKVSKYNSNARSVFEGSQLALTDIIREGETVAPDTAYICRARGDAVCVTASGEECDLTDYLGTEFDGYYGFMSDPTGSGSVYALWSEDPITAATFTGPMSAKEVKDGFETSVQLGCHPLRSDFDGSGSGS